MEKVLFATFEGKPLSADEVLQLPSNSRIKIIVDTEYFENQTDQHTTASEDIKRLGETQFKKNQERLIHLLQSWREEEDNGEQRETWEYLQRVLDEDRLSHRRLFS